MATLAHQHAEMETQLKEAAEENARRRKALREVRETMGSSPGSMISPPLAGAGLAAGASIGSTLNVHDPRRQSTIMSNATTQSYTTANSDATGSLAARRLGEQDGAGLHLDDQLTPPIHAQRASILGIADDKGMVRDSMDDADDEFFDAIETGNLPGLKVDKSLTEPQSDPDKWPEQFDQTLIDQQMKDAMAPYNPPANQHAYRQGRPSLCVAVGHPQEQHRKGSDQDLVPCQLQRTYVDASTYG